ncbi:MAG TPA: endolytic transglycosylase MltG, partial [Candidatus Binatia bacterium]|nr:endolytic transglycosylase MltG [Candidatus Binatia bacterium]
RRPYLLNADPTIIYAVDTVALRELPFEAWKGYTFWTPVGRPLAEVTLPDDLAGFQTYQRGGLIPAPIVSPSVASIDAVLGAETETGYRYFVAIPDGSGRHAFARTLAEHEANLRKYGYR